MYYCISLRFSQTIQKCQYWDFCLYCMRTEKLNDKMLPTVGIELGPLIASDSKPNTILSGLTWHLLVSPETWGSLYSHVLFIVA